MNTSTPAKTESTSRPPSPQESPLDSGFASRGPIHLTGLTFSEDDSEVIFKHPNDDHPSDNNTTIVDMGEIADLKAANTQLQRDVAQLKASLADVASLNDTVADLRQQVSDAHRRVAALNVSTAPDLDKLCDMTTSMQQRPEQPRPSAHRGPSVTLPRFDGSVYSSFEKWQRDLEIYFDYFNWPRDDAQRTNAIPHSHYIGWHGKSPLFRAHRDTAWQLRDSNDRTRQ